MWKRPSIAVVLFVTVVIGACTEHRVGPARTADDYERKARTTASAALSTVETVRLLAETSSEGKSFASYTNVSVSEQEDRLNEIEGDFASIQPPGPSSDELRDELQPILDSAADHIADVRIAARRGHLSDLDIVGAPLAADADALNRFLEQLS